MLRILGRRADWELRVGGARGLDRGDLNGRLPRAPPTLLGSTFQVRDLGLYWLPTMPLKLSEFDYNLPEELIARRPLSRRDQSRLMLVDSQKGRIDHHRFRDLPMLLEETDLLVLNDTRVFPARLAARSGNRKVEVLLLRELEPRVWEALIKPARRVPVPGTLYFDGCHLTADVVGTTGSTIRLVRFQDDKDFWGTIERIGRMPLPPYIRRPVDEDSELDRERYQTVFSRETGSVAAPTAGLHFTADLLSHLRHVFLTLHVGYGTFKPVRSEEIEAHSMDSEHYELGLETAARIERQRLSPHRIVSVGSTTTRVLEHVFESHRKVISSQGRTRLFIFPGFQFGVTDCLFTNFHLPRSTLFLLVCAFAGTELIQEAYRQAVQEKYRFYSYGDAMLIV